MDCSLSRQKILQAAVDANGLQHPPTPQLRARNVLGWIASVKDITSALNGGLIVDLAADWNNAGNIIMSFKYAAMGLARKCWPNRLLTDELNSFANSSPHL